MRETVKLLTFEEIRAAKNGMEKKPIEGEGEPTPVYLKSGDSEK